MPLAPMPDRLAFATNLGWCLYVTRVPQADLARRLKISEATVSRYVSGDRIPDKNTRERIARETQGVVAADLDAWKKRAGR